MAILRSSLIVTIVFSLLLPPSTLAFSGDGSKNYRLGMTYLFFDPSGKGAAAALRGSEREAAAAMSEVERYEEALEYLDRANRSSPSPTESKRLTKALKRTYNLLSLRYKDAGRTKEASEMAAQAVELNPEAAVLWFNLAVYQRDLGNTYDSVHSFEKCLELAKTGKLKTDTRLRLIDLLMKRALAEDKRDIHRALELIDDGLYEKRDDPDLLYKKAYANFQLGEWSQSVEAFDDLQRVRPLTERELPLYEEAKKRHEAIDKRGEIVEERAGFHISFDPDVDRSMSTKISNFLVDARDSLSPLFGVPVNTLINVNVHRAQEFQAIHKNRPFAGTCRLNRIDLRIRDGLKLERLKDTVFHEFTHYLVTAATKCGSVPCWYNEGLAQHFEPNTNMRKETIRGLFWFNSKRELSVKEIDKLQDLSKRDFYGAYTQSLFQVKYLCDTNGEERIIGILEQVAGGKTFEKAFESVIGQNQEAFFAAWRPLFREQLIELKNRHVPDWEDVKKKAREKARARKAKKQ